MKKIMFLLVGLFVFSGVVRADNDRPIAVEQLPQRSQQFIKQYFSKDKVSFAKVERDFFETRYEVFFVSSSKIEFLKNGDWKEVDCKHSEVPAAIVPQGISKQVNERYPDMKIIEIDRDGRGEYEVRLSNGLELTFDAKLRLVDIDD